MHTGTTWLAYFFLFVSINISYTIYAMNIPGFPPASTFPGMPSTTPAMQQPITETQPQQPIMQNMEPSLQPVDQSIMPSAPQIPSDMQIPAPPIEQKEEIPATEPETIESAVTGIDTVQLAEPRGNWHFKKRWWERGEQQYDKIEGAVEKIEEDRLQYYAKRTMLDKTVFDPFFVDIGFSQGELAATLSSLIDRIEQERQKEGMLNEQERELFDVLIKDRELIEQLHRDAQSIVLLENAADELIERVMQQRSRATSYEKEAWNYLKEIARILSDTQARELYYKIDASWRNIKNIQRYLEQDLQRYFDQLINNAKQQVERIKNAMQTLKEKGIDLKYSVEKISQQEPATSKEEQKPEPTPKPIIKKGIIARTFDFVSYGISAVWNMILWIPKKIIRLFRK
ncbi:MAG TPA: hypothetical protein VGW78_01685 [Candidatus Babeliales bacterium]|jgi:uncharacterized protein with GYD domain|nr:hypothetical protein [Candidatus Babeliales bacterium]